jgi:serine/threonine-protein kinase
VTVPDVINETQSVATATLQGLALTVRAGWSTYCGAVPYGDVVGQKPAAGSIVDSGTVAGIVVCDAMPNVLGLSEDVATATLQGLGLTVDTGNSDCAAPELGDVVDQAPVADAAAPPGSTVTLAICTQAITP